MALFTVILVVITGMYAWWTRRMAETMSKQIALESHPYVGFARDVEKLFPADAEDSKKIIDETEQVQIRYSIVNLGKVAIVYKVGEISFENEIGKPDGVEMILYPGQSMFYTTNTFKIPKTKVVDFKGKSVIKIIYWALEIPEKTYFSSRAYNFLSGDLYFILEDKAGKLI